MLHCNMNLSEDLKLGLEDVLASLWHARRENDLGRLASLCGGDVQRWALLANRRGLAARAAAVVLERPHADRAGLLAQVDALIAELECRHCGIDGRRP